MLETDWRRRGFRHSCLACGACCRGPGFAFLYPADVRRLAEVLAIDIQTVADKYCQPMEVLFQSEDGAPDERVPFLVLRKDDAQRCLFLDPAGRCGVHHGKPRQCKDSPFMPEFLELDESLEAFAAICPGWGRGRRYLPEMLATCIAVHNQLMMNYEAQLKSVGGDLSALLAVTLPPRPWPEQGGALL